MIKIQKLLRIQKNKFNQLKNAYDEVEREKEHIKVLKLMLNFFFQNFSLLQNILQQQQDTSIKRLSELREQIKLDRQAKQQLECLHQKEMKLKDNRIEELTIQV
jgi:hypothetical protein